MKRAAVFLLFLLICPSSLPAQSRKQLLLGLASISGGINILHVTKKTGAVKRNGLEVDFILFQGGSQALPLLLAGDVKMIKEFLRVNDDAIAEEAHDYFARITPAKPYPIVEGIRTVLDEIALTEPSAKNAKPEQFVDSSFIAKLDKSGFIDRLYKK